MKAKSYKYNLYFCLTKVQCIRLVYTKQFPFHQAIKWTKEYYEIIIIQSLETGRNKIEN